MPPTRRPYHLLHWEVRFGRRTGGHRHLVVPVRRRGNVVDAFQANGPRRCGFVACASFLRSPGEVARPTPGDVPTRPQPAVASGNRPPSSGGLGSGPSLDLSPWSDRPTTTTSLDRLNTECGEPLRELGFAKNDGNADWWRPGWTDRRWRPVWTGYTPEQRRLIRDGFKPAAVSHKELV